MSTLKVVHFYQMRLFHYRAAMFDQMRVLARDAGIDLHLVCGQASQNASSRKDEGSLPWVDSVKNRYIPISELKDLCWQPSPKNIARPDLVILMQENRLLSNYAWLLRRRFNGPRVAYWGHGRDLQADSPNSLRNRFKALLANEVDWYFAYTDYSLNILRDDEFPVQRITVVNNAIDTASLRKDVEFASAELLQKVRAELDMNPESVLGLYCGSLYPDKKLSLLVEACDIVHLHNPDFRLAVIGDGPDAPLLASLLTDKAWAKWVGTKRGVEKAAYFRLADFVLNPGGVGLHVLDAFAAGLPLLTTTTAKHGPEISYLISGRNGVVAEPTPTAFARAMEDLIQDRSLLSALSAAARGDGFKYSIRDMAGNFVKGMLDCLEAPRR